jgi:FMN phosphatase YigB (HAD superfamily)
MSKKAVIFDIDGVLAEKSPDRDYREYDKVYLDKPIDIVFQTMNSLYFQHNYNIILITGRKEYSRQLTIDWIDKNSCINGFDGIADYQLFMRRDKDHRKAEILKKEIYDNHIKDKYEVVAVFEDDPKICDMYKKENLFVYQILR